MDDAAVAKMFERVDRDESGTMDFDEFVDLVYVELRELIGLDHCVYGMPEYKLRRNPARHRRARDVFRLDADPFDSLLALERRGRAERARAHKALRVAHISRPVRTFPKAGPPKRRNALISASAARKQLALNIFDPEHHDVSSVPRKPEPVVEYAKPTLYFHPNYVYAGPAELPEKLTSFLPYPVGTKDMHRHADLPGRGHSDAHHARASARPRVTRVLRARFGAATPTIAAGAADEYADYAAFDPDRPRTSTALAHVAAPSSLARPGD